MRGIIIVCAACASTVAATAYAQGVSNNASAAEDQSSGELAEIIVTAEKRSEDLQSVPISIAVVDGEALRETGKVQIDEIVQGVPGVSVLEGANGPEIYIRGATNGIPGGDSNPTTTYLDGAVLDRQIQMNGAFFDVARVEVVRGPQGTLYGQNSVGGNVNIVTNDPVIGAFAGSAMVDVENYGGVHSEAAVDIPIGDKIAVRVAGFEQIHDGYLSSGQDDADNVGGRVKILAQPTDSLSILLATSYVHLGDEGPGIVPIPAGGDVRDQSNPWASDWAGPKVDITTMSESSGKVDWNSGAGTVTAFAAFVNTEQYGNSDALGTLASERVHESNRNEEVRYATPADWNLQLTVGAYNFSSYTNALFAFGTTITGPQPDKHDLYAGFAQATYPIVIGVRLTGGVRYTYDKESQEVLVLSPPYVDLVLPGAVDFRNWTYKVGLEDDVAAHSLVYGQVSTGFREGGLNNQGNGLIVPYATEKLTAYELGSKNRFMDQRLQINGELFYYDYANFQVANVVPPLNMPFNTSGAWSAGGEVEATWALTRDDQLDGSVSYLKTDLGDFSDDSGLTQYDHDVFDHSPGWEYNFAYDHKFRIANGANLDLRLGSHYETSSYADFRERLGSYVPGHSQSNARLAYNSSNGHWSIAGYVNNIENYALVTNYTSGTPGVVPPSVFLAPPRTYGAVLSVKF
jgi:iron complex outermembrane recepter protein